MTALEQIKRKSENRERDRCVLCKSRPRQELNKTLTGYFYNSGPQRGLTPLPDRPPTPVVSRKQRRSPRRPPNHFHELLYDLTGQCPLGVGVFKEMRGGKDPEPY